MADEGRQAARLPGVVKALGAVSLLNDFASEMIYPLLPSFLTSVLGAGAIALGVLDGLAEAVAALFKYIGGRLADRQGKRGPLVVGGYALASLARPLMGLAGAPWQVIALRATDRIGKGARTPARDAIIADATRPSIRGRAFGFHRAMDHAGAMVGPLVAFVLLSWLAVPERRVLLWSAVPGLLAVVVVGWAVVRYGIARRVNPITEQSPASMPDTADAPRATIVWLIVAFAFARLPETLFLLRLHDVGVAVAMAPIAWAMLHLVRMGASYPGGWAADRFGPTRTMIVGWALYAAVCAGLASARTGLTALGWFLAFGLVAAATESPERAFVAAWGRRRQRGTRFGIYHAGVGAAALPGGILLGAIYERAGGPSALLVSAGLAAALALAGLAVTWHASGVSSREERG